MHRLAAGEAVPDVRDLLALYEHERPPRGDRPYVLANMVGGIDGCAAVSGRVGALSEGVDAALFRSLRSVADVVLVGAETVRREGYGPVRLEPDLVERRRRRGQAEHPPVAVVTGRLDLDLSTALFTASTARPVIVTSADAPPDAVTAAREVADVVVEGGGRVDLGATLRWLRSDLGANIVLCEGGPSLLGQMAAAGLLDELCLTVAPVMGGDPLPLAIAPPGAALSRFGLQHVVRDGDTLFLRYTT